MVGIGPGGLEHLSVLAMQTLKEAEVVVGYKTYIDLIYSLVEDKEIISTGMRGEIARCEMAIEKARSGRNTVVVCSGDSGIYGLSGLILELLDRMEFVEEIEVEIIPGIPAFVAASSLLGAPLMHDFVCISLSDLLTPWEVIEKRIKCAAEGDFVVVLYNPRSKKRQWQLPRALEILKGYRQGSTPVGIVRNAMRKGEQVVITSLEKVREGEVDMFSILIIGNSSSLTIGDKIVTPRGYLKKYLGA